MNKPIKVSELHMAYLRMFGPETHAVGIPYSVAKTMEIKGLVEWVPPQFGTQMWGITDKGRQVVKSAT